VNPAELMQKATRSLKTARLAFEDGDMDGAASRAYYGMFNAARAALIHAGHNEAAEAKTHSGLISAVGQYLVKSGQLSGDHGRSLNEICQVRIAADYLGVAISQEEAEAAIKRADAFIATIGRLVQETPKQLPAPKQPKKRGR
jgi:uncharacterized protein (UPF0332 family)